MQSDKTALRRQVRAAFPGTAVRDAESLAIRSVLAALPAIRTAHCIAGYAAMTHEADMMPLLKALLDDGKVIALPCVDADGSLRFHQMTDPDALVPDAYGIPSPAPDAPVIDADDIDVMLVPLEAADISGNRLGKGGGYYDRLLSRRTDRTDIGIVLRYQLVPRVPVQSHDIPLHALCTPDGMRYYP